jgi:hypothetical protein
MEATPLAGLRQGEIRLRTSAAGFQSHGDVNQFDGRCRIEDDDRDQPAIVEVVLRHCAAVASNRESVLNGCAIQRVQSPQPCHQLLQRSLHSVPQEWPIRFKDNLLAERARGPKNHRYQSMNASGTIAFARIRRHVRQKRETRGRRTEQTHA